MPHKNEITASLVLHRDEPDPVEIHNQMQRIVRQVAFKFGIPESKLFNPKERGSEMQALSVCFWLIDQLVDCNYQDLANFFKISLPQARYMVNHSGLVMSSEIQGCTVKGQTAMDLKIELEYQLARNSAAV
jgi:hypothetical protein